MTTPSVAIADVDRAPPAAPRRVSVRALCAFTAKAGDLDLRFTPSPTAQEGIAGHRVVAARRGGTYRAEVPLQGRCDDLEVRGRADGYDAPRGRLEEVKTCRGPAERVPANHRALHWAQAETYAHLACADEGRDGLDVALVYFDIDSQAESPQVRTLDAAALRSAFEDRCRRYATWSEREAAHRAARDAALAALPFPHGTFRAGQRELAEAVYRGAAGGRCVLAQAPTGIGKTLATLYPALKSLTGKGLDKVYFLTAKTSGRRLALDALATLGAGRGLPLRVLELTARERACEHPGRACHGDACPLAQGFYDRLAAAREAAVDIAFLDREKVREIALAHGVCPYYLAQELAQWCDVVVGDYSHWFDASAMLHGMARAEEWQAVVLVDEAHNLVERGRAMYSAELVRSDLRAVARRAAAPVARALRALDRAWKQLLDGQATDYQVHEHLPEACVARVEGALAALAAQQAEQPLAVDPDALQCFFDLTRFARLAESCGPHTLFDVTRVETPGRRGTDSRICLRNVVPGPHLAPRYTAARSVVLFSATLAPGDYYREMLGLPESTVSVDVASPFDAAQLRIRTAAGISTRYAHRAASVAPIAALVAAQVDAAPGNYIAFFSSFDYLAQVADALARARPDIPAWRQSGRMSDADQQAFIDRFQPEGHGVGFAVLGGRFAEGIDLPGRRLVGAFVATLGLPQVNPVNEHMRERMERQFGLGYEYTYLYPGLRKVVQAAGRVIRTASDRGTLHLIDDRYRQARVRALLPAWWSLPADGAASR